MGNIPLAWYEDYPHRGYDIDGRAITKPPTIDEVSCVQCVCVLIGTCPWLSMYLVECNVSLSNVETMYYYWGHFDHFLGLSH